ncbi:phage late control D family protein, partial [Paraburkholderia caribensis]|uniref:phage late control D family protein n=1 Tax=Paraburkholderia caribensis TaxID=75105 RepID=UPI001590B6D2
AIGRSRLGRNFDFTVEVMSTSGAIELKSLIAQPVTLWIQQFNNSTIQQFNNSTIRQFDKAYQAHHGYVHTVRRLGSDGGITSFQVELSSWLHFLRF